jgi:hypothetical protein
LFQVSQRLAVGNNCVAKVGSGSQSFTEFLVGARVQFVLVLILASRSRTPPNRYALPQGL